MQNPAKTLTPATRGSLLVFFGALSISFGPLLIKSVETGATAAAFYRMLFGGLALFLIMLLKRQTLRPSRAALFFTILAGAAFSGDLFFWHRSIHLAGPGLSTILANFQVFILAALGVLFFGERPSLRLFTAIGLAFIGLVMLLEPGAGGLPPGLVRGVAYGLITACFLSVYILSLRQSQRVKAPLPLIPNMALVSFAASVVLGLTLVLEGGSFILPSATDAGFLALYGIGCQAIGWLMVSAGLPHISPGRAGLLLMAEPLFAFIWDVIFLGRPTGLMGYAGAGLTIFAIYLCLTAKSRN